jgi:hypothetical protein
VLTLEPVTLTLPVLEEVRERSIHILDRPGQTVVTVVELLSPTNKTNPGRGQYLAKRRALIREEIHLLELDLLLGGESPPLLEPFPPGDYRAILSRSDRRPKCEVFSWAVRQPLPVVPIPLRPADGDLYMDLGVVFAATFRSGRYTRAIDYSVPPDVPLGDEDLRWAAELAQAARR